MGAPEPEKSVHDRLSRALGHLERLTTATDPGETPHEEPKTVEEAVGRLKDKVPGEG